MQMIRRISNSSASDSHERGSADKAFFAHRVQRGRLPDSEGEDSQEDDAELMAYSAKAKSNFEAGDSYGRGSADKACLHHRDHPARYLTSESEAQDSETNLLTHLPGSKTKSECASGATQNFDNDGSHGEGSADKAFLTPRAWHDGIPENLEREAEDDELSERVQLLAHRTINRVTVSRQIHSFFQASEVSDLTENATVCKFSNSLVSYSHGRGSADKAFLFHRAQLGLGMESEKPTSLEKYTGIGTRGVHARRSHPLLWQGRFLVSRTVAHAHSRKMYRQYCFARPHNPVCCFDTGRQHSNF
jgi:hypothetical protein